MSTQIRLLLVEDKDDPHVVSALLNAHNVPVQLGKGRWGERHYTLQLLAGTPGAVDVQVKIADGVEDLLLSLPTECKGSDVESLAAIVDADEDIVARWAEVSHSLVQAGCGAVPGSPPADGLILQMTDGPRVGVWVMPDNASAGMLEDLAISLIPGDDKVFPLVKAFIDGIPEGIRPFPACHRSKVLIHTWLGLQAEPGKPLGQAITAAYLEADNPACRPFTCWLRAVLLGEPLSGQALAVRPSSA